MIAQNDDQEEPFDLSPFEVQESEESGYKVVNSTAGMRINTELKDFGASISVITQEFMEDLGATDGQSLLSMVGIMEVGGVQGNISQTSSSASTVNARNNPQEEQRVRGLASAILTRDLFRTNLPFDSYNTSRITINRGQNTMLYGIGSPGGVIESTIAKAQIGSNFGEVAVRVDHRGSHRQTLDLNKTLVQDRLALRFSLLNESTQFKQDPAFEKESRFFTAWDAVLLTNERSSVLGKTRFRGNYEQGEITRNPPDVVPPLDGFSSWFEGIGGQEVLNGILSVPGRSLEDIPNGAVKKEWVLSAIEAGLVEVPANIAPEFYAAIEGTFVPKSEYNRITTEGRQNFHGWIPYTLESAVNFNGSAAGTIAGWQNPDLTGVQAMMGRWRPDNFQEQNLRWSSPVRVGAGFNNLNVQDRAVFDYHNLLWQGNTNWGETDFDAKQLILEQDLFGGNAGIELAYDRQHSNQTDFNPFSGGNSKTIFIDATSQLAPADGDFDGRPDRTPNENVGRPVTLSSGAPISQSSSDWETFRATVFGKLDVGDYWNNTWGEIIGSHILTGLYEDHTKLRTSRTKSGAWWADQGDQPAENFISGGLNDSFSRQVISQVYLGPDVRNLDSPKDLRITGPLNLTLPQLGDTFGVWYFDNRPEVDKGAINEWQVIEYLRNAYIQKENIESRAASLQSHWLWDSIVTTYGVRKDRGRLWHPIDNEEFTGPTGSLGYRLDDPGINITDGNYNEARLVLDEVPIQDTTGETTTWSLVAHYPEKWLGNLPAGIDLSAHYYEADSFEPNFGIVNILNEFIDQTRSDTREWGVTLSLFDKQLTIRFNHFETVRNKAPAFQAATLVPGEVNWNINLIAAADFNGIPLFPSAEDQLLTPDTFPNNRQRTTGTDADLIGVNSYEEYYERIIEILPPRIQETYNLRMITQEEYENETGEVVIGGGVFWAWYDYDGRLFGTEDYVARGTELEVIGNITENWSLSLNVSQQETVRSNVGPLAIPLAFETLERVKSLGLYDIRDDPYNQGDTTIGYWFEEIIREVRIDKAQEGIASPEQREWRINLLTRYDFKGGFLKGFSAGGALRYQDKVSAGYTDIWNETGEAVPDVANPFYGPDEMNGDLFLRYTRKITEKLEWSIQFNARNLYRKNSDDDIPVTINPDGRVALIRIPNEQQFFLTNTFRF
ncbi:MAG: TonB-dependent receptor plug domain-containing protein [Verrucomicrobia bacterium]|nr:TonB-dependent receptor plug domain-containing protein [Verrucomicrobiota bacterium]MDA1065058.1 TonB-dependent receptor plug domain-containing protein [Verrucomicrobiota bacterium]